LQFKHHHENAVGENTIHTFNARLRLDPDSSAAIASAMEEASLDLLRIYQYSFKHV